MKTARFMKNWRTSPTVSKKMPILCRVGVLSAEFICGGFCFWVALERSEFGFWGLDGYLECGSIES